MLRIAPGLWKHEHRVVMEREVNRTLLPTEHVHHKNRDKTDNRLENLQLLTAQEHALLHAIEDGRVGQWAIFYDACIDCGTTSRPHKGYGRCELCYQRAQRHVDPSDYRRIV